MRVPDASLVPDRLDILATAGTENELLLSLLDDAVFGGMFVADAARFRFASRGFALMLGLAPAQLVNIPFLACFHPANRGWMENALQGEPPVFPDEPQLVGLVSPKGKPRREVLLRLRPAPYLGKSFFVGTGLDITESRRSERAMADYARRLRVLSQQVLDVQENERRNLARELHDEIGQQLTMVKLMLARIAGRDKHAELDEALGAVSSLMQQVRDLSLDLRPSMLDDLGLVPALRWYADRVARLASIPVQLEIDPDFPRLRPEVETLFFRVAQEAITNVMRHAGATIFGVSVRIHRNIVELRVTDDGGGFNAATARSTALQGGSAGLLGMQERAALAGARLDLKSAVGCGTRLRLAMPVARAGHSPFSD